MVDLGPPMDSLVGARRCRHVPPFPAGKGYLAFAERIAVYLIAHAEEDANGIKWTQADRRIEPDNIVERTGRMQGQPASDYSLFAWTRCIGGKNRLSDFQTSHYREKWLQRTYRQLMVFLVRMT
jgi:hypothetical protein